MARTDGCRVRVWCEDRRQEQFVRSIMDRFGFQRRDVNFFPAPRGHGDASAWVTAHYASDLIVQARATRNQANLGFLAVIDGDNRGLLARMRQLCGQPDERDAADRIAIWVPTWSIETWLLWLNGDHAIDESTSFKNRVADDQQGRRLAKNAAEAWDPAHPEESESLPSLAAARIELLRLPGV